MALTTTIPTPPGFKGLTTFFFLLKGANNLLLVMLTSLFLKQFGAAGLPWYYVGSNLLFIGSQLLILRSERWKGFAFLRRLSIPMVLFTGTLAIGAPSLAGWLYVAALLAMNVYDLHATQAFSDLSGQILPLREAKRLLPTVYAAGTVGSILSGLLLKFLAEDLGFPVMFLLVTGLMLISAWILTQLRKHLPATEDASTVANIIPQVADRLPPDSAVSRLAWIILPMSCLAIFCRMLVEFMYTGSLSAWLPSAAELAGFLGLFGAAIDLTVLFLQSVLGGWVFTTVSLGSIMAFRAGAMVVASIAGFAFPSIVTVAGAQFVLMSLTKSFINPAFVLVLEPLPKQFRYLLRRYVSLGDSSANLTAGLFLLGMKSVGVGADPRLYLVVGAAFLGMLALTLQVNRSYSGVVAETLKTSEGQGDFEVVAGVRFIPAEERMAHIASLLANPDPEVRHHAILVSDELDPHEAAELLLTSMANEDHPRNLAAMVRVILRGLGPEGVELIEELLRDDSNPRFQADIIEALGQAEHARAGEIAAGLLQHPHHRVRGNAILATLRQGVQLSQLENALQQLLEMIRSLDPLQRATAAVVMGSAGLPVFVPALARLAEDERSDVSRHAFQSLAGIRTPAAVQVIAHHRQGTGERSEQADAAWKRIEAGDDSQLVRVLSGLSAEERGKLGLWLRMIRGEEDMALLVRVLRIPSQRSRELLIGVLGNPDPVNRRLIEACVLADGNIDPQPLISELERHRLEIVPPFAELAGPLCGKDCLPFQEFLHRLLSEVWRQAVALEFLASDRSWAPEADLDGLRKRFSARLQVVFHLVAFASDDPAELFQALEKAGAGDNFLHSVALEFLESRLGKTTAGLLFPLLEIDRNSATLMSQAREKCGIDPQSPDRATIKALLDGMN